MKGCRRDYFQQILLRGLNRPDNGNNSSPEDFTIGGGRSAVIDWATVLIDIKLGGSFEYLQANNPLNLF